MANKHALYEFYTPYDAPKDKNAYTSGPMTGHEDLNRAAFAECASGLRSMGYAVCNPHETTDFLENGGRHLSHAQFLRFDFKRVLEADFVVALPGWEQSLGALAEIHVALRIGLKVWRWENFEDYDRITMEDFRSAISDLHFGKAEATTVGAE